MQKELINRKSHFKPFIIKTFLRYSIILSSITILSFHSLRAEDSYPRNGYLSLGYGTSKFIQQDNPDIKSALSLTFKLGHTYHLHKKPVAKCIWFDIDATWFNINYSSFNVEHIDWQTSFQCKYHIPYIGMQIGPGISIEPFNEAQIHAFARYSPSIICLLDNNSDNNLSSAYGSFWDFGLEFNYRAIGIGIDYTTGKSNLPKLEFMSNSFFGESQLSTLSSMRFILSIKF